MEFSLAKPGTPPAAAPESTAAHASVFRREGEYWTIACDGIVLRLRDTKGLRYLACLLHHPGERFAVHSLMAAFEAQPLESSSDPPQWPDAERARLAVTKRIKDAIRRIQDHYPALGHHFMTTVKTGYACAYRPDPTRPVGWTGSR